MRAHALVYLCVRATAFVLARPQIVCKGCKEMVRRRGPRGGDLPPPVSLVAAATVRAAAAFLPAYCCHVCGSLDVGGSGVGGGPAASPAERAAGAERARLRREVL